MHFFDYIAVLFTLTLFIYIFYLLDRRGKKPSEPTSWPVVGMLPVALLKWRWLHVYITELLNEVGGTYVFKGPWFCNLDMLFTSDPANVNHIFSKNFPSYPKGHKFKKIFDVIGDGIFNVDFELWEVHRRTTLSVLTGPVFHRTLERTIWGKVRTGLVPVLDYFCAQGIDVDLQEVFQRFTFDNISEIVLDYDPNSLRIDLPYIPFEKAFNNALEPLFYRHIIPETIWKLQNWLKIGKEKTLIEAFRTLDGFIYSHIHQDSKLVSAFKKIHQEIDSSRNLTDFLKDTLLNLIFAGRDTTSTCLTWLFYLIALNPSSQIKICEEIESKLHMQDKSKWRFFSADESTKLVYLHGALCESLRLYPPLPFQHKSPTQSDVLPSGHCIRANARIIVPFYSSGRMEMVWGKDCQEFKPERWITPGGGIKFEPSYKFPAFNAGPRTCIGKEMAFTQMKMVAATVVYHYKVELVEGHPVTPRQSIILQAKYGLKVRLMRRNP